MISNERAVLFGAIYCVDFEPDEGGDDMDLCHGMTLVEGCDVVSREE